MVDYTGLENRRTETCRGFESLSFRKGPVKEVLCDTSFIVLLRFVEVNVQKAPK